MSKLIPNCPECGERFANIFEACDHLVTQGNEFDPYLVLPGGYRLFLGSLMKHLFDCADDPEQVEAITQDVYATMFVANANSNIIPSVLMEEMVKSVMSNIDVEYKELTNDTI